MRGLTVKMVFSEYGVYLFLRGSNFWVKEPRPSSDSYTYLPQVFFLLPIARTYPIMSQCPTCLAVVCHRLIRCDLLTALLAPPFLPLSLVVVIGVDGTRTATERETEISHQTLPDFVVIWEDIDCCAWRDQEDQYGP